MLCLPDAAARFLRLYLCFLVVFCVFETGPTCGDGGLPLPNQFEIDERISRIDIGQKAFRRISAHRIYFKSNGLTSHEMAEKVSRPLGSALNRVAPLLIGLSSMRSR